MVKNKAGAMVVFATNIAVFAAVYAQYQLPPVATKIAKYTVFLLHSLLVYSRQPMIEYFSVLSPVCCQSSALSRLY